MIKINPPIISAFSFSLSPNLLPMATPASDMAKVTLPMTVTASKRLTLKNENVTPTASASMLVATAKIKSSRKENPQSCVYSSSSDIPSFTILKPIITSRKNAIQ